MLDGVFGCSGCRCRFPVVAGVGDLRASPRAGPHPSQEGESPAVPDREEVIRLAALLAVSGGPGHLAVVGELVPWVAALAELIGEIEVVGLARWAGPMLAMPDRPGVSYLAASAGLPFRKRSLRGIALTGKEEKGLLEQAVEVGIPGARIVSLRPRPEDADELRRAGADILIEEQAALVGVIPSPEGRRSSGVALPVIPARR